MASTNLGACEWFVRDIRRSHLIDNETLDQAVATFLIDQPQGEPPALAEHMVYQKLLTPLQAKRLLQGKSHDLELDPHALLETVGAGSTPVSPVPSQMPAESSAAKDSAGVISEATSAAETLARKQTISTPPELSATPLVPAALALAPKALAPKIDEPDAFLVATQAAPAISDDQVEARQKQTLAKMAVPLPDGATKALEKASLSVAADYSVFEMPAVNDPKAPATAKGFSSFPVMPKLQPDASPQDSVPVPDDVILWKSLKSHLEFINPGHSLEERFGFKGILLIALSAGFLVFVLGYLLFSLLVHS
jgi:hypothetical protein